MKHVVIDASMAAAWLLPDERAAATDAVLDQMPIEGRSAPSVFWYEIHNILLMAERRGRLRREQTDVLLPQIGLLNIEDAGSGSIESLIVLARRSELTVYDAAYLDLAMSKKAALATLDRRLAEAARREGVSLYGPLAP